MAWGVEGRARMRACEAYVARVPDPTSDMIREEGDSR